MRLLVVLHGCIAILGLVNLEENIALELEHTHGLEVFVYTIHFSDLVVSFGCLSQVIAENLALAKYRMQIAACFELGRAFIPCPVSPVTCLSIIFADFSSILDNRYWWFNYFHDLRLRYNNRIRFNHDFRLDSLDLLRRLFGQLHWLWLWLFGLYLRLLDNTLLFYFWHFRYRDGRLGR
jgi:hypothetical protein